VEIITSLQNSKVKLTKGLQSRARTRRKERKIVLEGTRLIRDAIEHKHKPLFVIYEKQSANQDLIALLESEDIELMPVNDEVLLYLSETPHPQGVIGVFPLPVPHMLRKPATVLILDTIRDPGNLGTILRTAAAAGVQVVILSPGCADPYNPKTLRSGMGAHFRIPIIEATWENIEGYCQSLNVYLATGKGDLPYDQADWQSSWALIIGNEAHGAGDESANIASSNIFIPMDTETESLNAAVATGVILFEAARHKR